MQINRQNRFFLIVFYSRILSWNYPTSRAIRYITFLLFASEYEDHKKWYFRPLLFATLTILWHLLSCSVVCAPSLIKISNFIGNGIFLWSLIRIHSPIKVAKEQWGTVGLNSTRTTFMLAPVGCLIYNTKKLFINCKSSNVGIYYLTFA